MAQEIQILNPDIRFLDKHLEDQTSYTFAIVIAEYQNSWLWVRHRDRTTWELPAGHVEPGETVDHAANRELFEETGALNFDIFPISSYQGWLNSEVVYGKVFFARIKEVGVLPGFEIIETRTFQELPSNLTYPDSQPLFFQCVMDKLGENGIKLNLTHPVSDGPV